MKVIKANAIQAVTASSANSAYPAANLLNESPKKKWQAADTTVTFASIQADVYQATGGLGMVGIVAESAHVSISDPNGITWSNVIWSNVIWADVPDAVEVDVEWVETGDDYKTLWVSFEQFESAVKITVELRKTTGNPDILAAGVLVVGQVVDIPGVKYPLSEGLVDYSIYRQLSNGADYYKRRDIVRTFSGSMILKRDLYFQTFMRGMARVFGMTPFMVLLVDWSMDFVIYGRFQQLPSGSHAYLNHSTIDFQLIEVL